MKILTVLAAHTNSAIKQRCLQYSLPRYADISEKVVIANSSELADAAWEANLRAQCPELVFQHLPNDALVDTGKWYAALMQVNWQDFDAVLLVNDSVAVTQPLDGFVELLHSGAQETQMFGMVDSTQSGYHLQSHFRALRRDAVQRFLDYIDHFRPPPGREVPFSWIIQAFEVKLSAAFTTRALYSCRHDARFAGGENLLFLRELYWEYLVEKHFPLVKIKYLTECDFQYEGKVPEDFSPSIYRSLHADLSHLDEQQAAMHFARYGINEGRRYRADQKKTFHPALRRYLEERGMDFLFSEQLIPVAD